MSKILVLGGSYLQSHFILTAVEQGHSVTFVDQDPNCYSKKIIGAEFENIDFSNILELKRLHLKKGFDSIISPANEFGNLIAAKLCKGLNIFYNHEDVVLNTYDKYLLRKELRSSTILSPKNCKYDNNSSEIVENLNFPLIIKPSNSSASRGITAVNSLSELVIAINEAKKFVSKGGCILIEEYIEGEQFSIETISANNEHFIVGITKEITSGPPDFIERCHFITPEIYNENFDRFNPFVINLLNKLNVKIGPSHIEVIVRGRNIYLVEIGTRTGGLRDQLLKFSKGPDYNKLVIDAYLLQRVDKECLYKPTKSAMVGILMYPDDLTKYKQAEKSGEINEAFFYEKEPLINPKNLTDSFGYFYVSSNNDVFQYTLK